METEPSLLARVYEWGWALLVYWWILAPGGIFALEPMMESFLREDRKERLATIWPKPTRHKTFRVLSFLALALASFLAFDDVNSRNRALQKLANSPIQESTINRLSGDLTAARGKIDEQQRTIEDQKREIDTAQKGLAEVTARYARSHLLNEQKTRIQQIAKTPEGETYSISVFQPSDCYDCNEYSTDFIETLTAPSVGWKLTLFTTMHGGINPHFRGIALIVKDPQNPPQAALVLAGALKAADIQFVGTSEAGFNISQSEVGLLVAPKSEQ